MNSTPTALDSISELIEAFEAHEDYAGHGYLGERRAMLAAAATGEADADVVDGLIAQADAMIDRVVADLGWDLDELFAWANSKAGRWFGDCWFGSNGRHAERCI